MVDGLAILGAWVELIVLLVVAATVIVRRRNRP